MAAAKAAISTASAYRIESDPQLLSQKQTVRGRRRPDPLAGIFGQEVIPRVFQEWVTQVLMPHRKWGAGTDDLLNAEMMVNAGKISSSPWPSPRAATVTSSAAVPIDTATPCRRPTKPGASLLELTDLRSLRRKSTRCRCIRPACPLTVA